MLNTRVPPLTTPSKFQDIEIGKDFIYQCDNWTKLDEHSARNPGRATVRYFSLTENVGKINRKLSEIPYSEIFIGMEVISAVGTEGRVVEKPSARSRVEYEWVRIDWDNGKWSVDSHQCFNKVSVKEM